MFGCNSQENSLFLSLDILARGGPKPRMFHSSDLCRAQGWKAGCVDYVGFVVRRWLYGRSVIHDRFFIVNFDLFYAKGPNFHCNMGYDICKQAQVVEWTFWGRYDYETIKVQLQSTRLLANKPIYYLSCISRNLVIFVSVNKFYYRLLQYRPLNG